MNEKTESELVESFEKQKNSFGWKIVMVGMVVVFSSLILVSLLIGSLQHFINPKIKKIKIEPKKTVQTPIGKISANEGDLSTNAIIAVITALHAHVEDVEQRNKIIMDWRRAPVSMWKSVNKASFPNHDHNILNGR